MLEIMFFLLGIICGLLIVWSNVIPSTKYCNRNYNYYKDSLKLQLKVPQYEVKKYDEVGKYNIDDILVLSKK